MLARFLYPLRKACKATNKNVNQIKAISNLTSNTNSSNLVFYASQPLRLYQGKSNLTRTKWKRKKYKNGKSCHQRQWWSKLLVSLCQLTKPTAFFHLSFPLFPLSQRHCQWWPALLVSLCQLTKPTTFYHLSFSLFSSFHFILPNQNRAPNRNKIIKLMSVVTRVCLYSCYRGGCKGPKMIK